MAGSGFAEEEPVLLSEGGWPNGVFHEVVIDLNATVFEVEPEKRPLVRA